MGKWEFAETRSLRPNIADILLPWLTNIRVEKANFGEEQRFPEIYFKKNASGIEGKSSFKMHAAAVYFEPWYAEMLQFTFTFIIHSAQWSAEVCRCPGSTPWFKCIRGVNSLILTLYPPLSPIVCEYYFYSIPLRYGCPVDIIRIMTVVSFHHQPQSRVGEFHNN